MTYIHPESSIIDAFIQTHIEDRSSIKAVCEALFRWFDQNIIYSRLNAPFFPLQRSDLDLLSMLAGTCGDYANLLVCVFQKLGYEAKYAYIHKDCYGDEQDHICAAVRDGAEWILVDATLPYRKWHGFHCPHQDYELFSPEAFEAKMKNEERHWTDVAKRYGDERFAGLLYAPWIHEEIIRQSDDALESVFFLLLLDDRKKATLYAYDKKYTRECGTSPAMCVIADGIPKYCFSCKEPAGIWDPEQYSEPYRDEAVPSRFDTAAFRDLKDCVSRIWPAVSDMLAGLENA